LGFLSAIVMAYPIIRFRKVEINVRTAWTGDMFSERDATMKDMSLSRSEVYAQFNKDLWDSFADQRKFALIALALLGLSLAIQASQS
jgi:hypothetical protein